MYYNSLESLIFKGIYFMLLKEKLHGLVYTLYILKKTEKA